MSEHKSTGSKDKHPGDTPTGVGGGGGGESGPKPELQRRVVSGDRNTNDLAPKEPKGRPA